MSEDGISVSLIIAVVTALVGLLCLSLAIVGLLRARSAARGAPAGLVEANSGPVETPAELQSFAARQMFSAAVMFAFAVVIYIYS